MSFALEVKTNGEQLRRGDFFYEKRRLFRVERVGKERGKERRFTVKFRLVAKVNLDKRVREDRYL
jgi:hypothetical protein